MSAAWPFESLRVVFSVVLSSAGGYEHFGIGRLAFGEGPVLGGFKFVVQGRLRPVYRRPRFDNGEGLLSGPAWAGVLAVISARRAALRVWLGEGAARLVVVGALTVSLGVQVSTSASRAQNSAKGGGNPSHSSAGRATGGSALGGALSQLSESAGDHRAQDGKVREAAQAAPLDVGGGQGRSFPVPGMSNAPAPDEQIVLLSGLGAYELSGPGGSNSGSGRPTNRDSDSSESSTASQSSDSSGLPSNDTLPGAGGVSRWLPIPVLVPPAGSGSIDIASGSTRVFNDLRGAAPGSIDPGAAGASGGPSGSPNIPGPGGISQTFPVPGVVSAGSGVLAGVPEPSAWAIMILGLTLVGSSARQRRARA